MKKILILNTGGTIAMQEGPNGTILKQQLNPLYSTIESLSTIASVIVDDYLNIPSPHMTPQIIGQLAKHMKKRVEKDQLEGIVITHGTDTLEETAYLLDLLLDWDLPLIVTGAMRSSNELGSDGPHNLISAVKVAVCKEAEGKGVLVVLNDEIHTAKNVTKTHSSNIATFQSPQYGPIGIVTKRGVIFHHTLTNRESFNSTQLNKNVALIKTYTGMDPCIIDAIHKTNIDGFVIEAFGQGNVPPELVKPIRSLLSNNIPVILVSRCFSGIVQDIYAYEGGGRTLKELGVIFANGLNGQKARLKLMVILEQTSDLSQIQALFEQ
ncbi:asparaginase [Halalkalibacter hemicellulosilyticus]|uniref:asparaginase n=1 Tax=Halalkalibacter hemicellulosilyticusJCM 9152 TaxID=1236971 RepID=W4QAJ9_9BACI|nr:asparaginase [Halalkalibacter hemicellulosilyticus]GAE28987.1 L-asparaginase [Halalkalibacter hemicellulosilyticusJCM 9152]